MYKYRCAECGKVIETELYYGDDDECPKENSLLGLGLYHSDLEHRKTIDSCDGVIVKFE